MIDMWREDEEYKDGPITIRTVNNFLFKKMFIDKRLRTEPEQKKRCEMRRTLTAHLTKMDDNLFMTKKELDDELKLYKLKMVNGNGK